MKAVILAGGLGTRISEESYFKPKPVIKIWGPVLSCGMLSSFSLHMG